MKEGYFQIKIGQLDEMLKQIKNDCIKLGIQLQVYDKKIGDYDVVLSKLNDLEKFRLDLLEALLEENKSLLNTYYKSILNKMEKLVNKGINPKLEKIDNFLSETEYNNELVIKYLANIHQISLNQEMLDCIFRTLINKISEKNIFSDDEASLIYTDAKRAFKSKERKRRKLVEK